MGPGAPQKNQSARQRTQTFYNQSAFVGNQHFSADSAGGYASIFCLIGKVQKSAGLDIVGSCQSGGMADAADSKSVARKGVWVQVPPLVLSFVYTFLWIYR
jgi:hypothetical protein